MLDEADRMLDMGFSDDMMTIAAATNAMKQTWMFSATLGHAGVSDLGKELLLNPQQIHIAGARDQHSDIEQKMILADDDTHKVKMLTRLLTEQVDGKVIIFTNTKRMTEQLGQQLSGQFAVAMLHGDMNQDERNFVTQRFRLGKERF